MGIGTKITEQHQLGSGRLRAVSDHPILTTASFVVVGTAMVLAEPIAAWMPVLLLLASICLSMALLLRGATVWWRHRDPRRPRAPRLQRARLPWLPSEPPQQVHELAYNCVICGRPLTNPQSMRARVGSTCIQRYGPRYKLVPNPDHERWRGLVAAAEADRAAEQARLKHAYERAVDEHRRLVATWEQERASPGGQIRQRRRSDGRRLMIVGSASVPALIVGVSAALQVM